MENQRLKVFMLAERFAPSNRAPSRGPARSETLADLIEQKCSVASICPEQKDSRGGLDRQNRMREHDELRQQASQFGPRYKRQY